MKISKIWKKPKNCQKILLLKIFHSETYFITLPKAIKTKKNKNHWWGSNPGPSAQNHPSSLLSHFHANFFLKFFSIWRIIRSIIEKYSYFKDFCKLEHPELNGPKWWPEIFRPKIENFETTQNGGQIGAEFYELSEF